MIKEYIMQETEEQETFGNVWRKYKPVQELVRCRDCVYRRQDDVCTYNWHATTKDWFCADGERIE